MTAIFEPKTLTVPRQFCGPPSSGNGGWVAGALASLAFDDLDTTVEVTLSAPPPLDRPLPLTTQDGRTVASDPLDADRPIATARVVETALSPVAPVGWEQAREAEAAYAGLRHHPFATCFGCGTGREVGDGLRIFPGPVAQGPQVANKVAATWQPDAVIGVDTAVIWSALDCIGGWAGDFGERLMVLGRMTARLHALPTLGADYVLVGEDRGTDGRKVFAATSLYDASGTLVAQAEQVWFKVDAGAFV